MAIQIRKKAEEEKKVQVLEPDVLPPENAESMDDLIRAQKAQAPGMEDKFVMRSGNAMAWLMEHRRMVLLVTILILVAAFSWIGVQKYQESIATSQSSDVLSDAFVTYAAYTKAQADQIENERYEYFKSQGIAAEADDILHFSYTVPDDRSRFAAIEKHLDTVIPTYAGNPIEASASLMLAGTKAKIRDAASAQTAYQKAETSLSRDVKLFGMLGEAEMLIGQKKLDEALKKLEDVVVDNPALTSQVTYEKGRIFEMKGDMENALAMYDQLIQTSGNSIPKQKAKVRLRILTPDWAERIAKQEQVQVPQAEL